MGLGRDHYILLNASSIRTRGHVCHDGPAEQRGFAYLCVSVSLFFFWFGFVSFFPSSFSFYFFLLIIRFFLIREHLF
jgi:hypothetical protein